MNSITVAELAFWRNNAFDHVLFDVRRQVKREADDAEIGNGQWLDPALWLDWKDHVPQGKPIIMYCAYGHEIGQGMAAVLRAMGHDARFLEGGIDAWQAAGFQVQQLERVTQ